jgi:hypothetical protein
MAADIIQAKAILNLLAKSTVQPPLFLGLGSNGTSGVQQGCHF